MCIKGCNQNFRSERGGFRVLTAIYIEPLSWAFFSLELTGVKLMINLIPAWACSKQKYY